MSYANDILAKCENGAVQMLRVASAAGTLTLVPAASVLPGFGDSGVVLPRVVCSCDSADVSEMYDGNWNAALEVEVRASFADTTREQFRAMCAEVFAHFMLAEQDVAAALSNADDPFTAFKCDPIRQTRSIESGAGGDAAEWSVKFSFTVKCCGTVIT